MSIVQNAYDLVEKTSTGVLRELDKLYSGKLNIKTRSDLKQEEKDRELKTMDPAQMASEMRDLIEKSGHMYEGDGCSLCQGAM